MVRVEYRQSGFRVPAGATDVVLVRHGESAPAIPGEPFELVGGQGDPDLAPPGREQADLVGERLAEEAFAALYVTNLRRTAQTAAPLATKLDMTPRVAADLREVHLGEFEGGLFRVKAAENDLVIQRMHAEGRWDVIPGAEPTDAFRDRIRAALARLAAAHPDERIAVFTHGGVIGQIIELASGARPMSFLGAANGSISQIVITGERWIVRRFNDTAHLGDGQQPAALG
ncbi:histidine phosphatase family protein [Saccharopolyspora griseoalba]|uniref:Histidine phosphatase family protein n=1 Tax=Saccharopolyspora griseoalba TaxID=1431848 RepID=A0ABW2LFH1_9PSEU